MTNPDWSTERRDAVLNAAREIAEKARLENRGLTGDEQAQIDAAIAEAREINAMHAGDAKARQIMSQLDAQAAGGFDPANDGSRRLDFKQMAAAAVTRMLPADSFGQKALAPSGATVIAQTFSTDPIALGQPAANLLSVLPVTVQQTSLFAYMRQTTRTNAAAVVAEGAVKPTSTYSVTKVEQALSVIAHLSEPVTRFWFIDAPSLQQWLNSELLYGLSLAIEAKALADISAVSGAQTQAWNTSTLGTLRRSVTKIEANDGSSPACFVLHPIDWESVELQLLSTPAVEYNSLPFDPVARRLWGVPVCITNAATVGTAHTLAQGAVALNVGSEGVQISWSESSNADDFSKNLVRARCEGRYATSVFRPLGVVISDLTP